MQIGMIGLGQLGARIVRRLLAAGHQCVVFDACPRVVAELGAEKAFGAASIADLANELDAPRVIWLADPPGGVDATLTELRRYLAAADLIVDCGRTTYADDVRRAAELATIRVHYVDVGINGPGGDDYCLTIGGDRTAVRQLEPVLRALAAPHGYLHCGRVGAGHFVRMIHNGIERCLSAAYAEGFDVLRGATGYEFNLRAIAEVWMHGSLLGSPVLERMATALAQDPSLQQLAGKDLHGRDEWQAIRAAVDEAVPIPVLMSTLYSTNK